MRNLSFAFILVFIFIGCKNDRIPVSNLISLAPENSSIIIRTKNIESLKSSLNNNDFINSLTTYKDVQLLKQKLSPLNHLKTNNTVLICLGKDAKDSLQVSIITKYTKNLFAVDSLPNHSSETITTKQQSITKTTINKQTLYSIVIDSVFFGSNQRALVETTSHNLKRNKTLEKIYHTADDDKTLSVLINSKNNALVPSFFEAPELNKASLSNYYLLDTDISQDQMLISGITKATDSSKSLINSFKNTIPQENLIAKVSPVDVDNFISFTFDNYKTFQENLSAFKTQDSLTKTAIFDNASEIGVLKRNQSQAVIIHSIDALSTQETIASQPLIETYREIAIHTFENPKLFSQHFSPLITYNSASNYIQIDDFFVFSDDVSFLKDIIASYQNSTNLYESNAYQNMMEHLSDESSLFLFKNANGLNAVLDANFSENKNLKIDSYKASAIQFSYDSDFALINAIIKKDKAKAVSNSISEEANIKLDDDMLINPQLVTDYTTNHKDIVVQDVKNNLYQITKDGKVLWKKQLDGKILGNIEQIDLYKNGKLQLAFATPKRVYVIDRNGKDVSPYPLKFNDVITQPLSVFDYDNKKDYRLLVCQGKALLMYDKQGKTVRGFTYKKADNTINTQPKHFRIGRKDYIVFGQGQKMEILDRTGKTRINVKEAIDFSNNDIFLYNDKFTTTNTKGDLVQVDEKGRVNTTNLNLAERHFITTTSKTLVTLSENNLTIKSNKIELDFGDYTAPEIYYLNDKIYVATTDLQANKVYLFDSQAKPINNFPVFGNSTILLDNLDKDKTLEAVTKGDNNSIIVYEIN